MLGDRALPTYVPREGSGGAPKSLRAHQVRVLGMTKRAFLLLLCVTLATILPLYGAVWTEAPLVWPLSTLSYTAGLLGVVVCLAKGRLRLFVLALAAVPLMLLDDAFFVSYYLQNKGFNQAFWYHARPDVVYAGLGEHAVFLVVFPALAAAYLVVAFRYLRGAAPCTRRYVGWGSLAVFVFGVAVSPPARSAAEHWGRAGEGRSAAYLVDFPELASGPVLRAFRGTERYNLVLIYLESIEQRYFDEAVFPGLLPELKAVMGESLVFTNVGQVEDAGFTMGGVVAAQCGYPLAGRHEISSGSFGMYQEFMPSAVCLGDLLGADGYRLTYLGGADSRFAGKGKFLRAHGYSEVIDRDEILKRRHGLVPLNAWGVYDDTLLEEAFEEFLALSAGPTPFVLTLLTLDTHHPAGHLSPSCGGYPAVDNSILDAAHCTDALVGQFLQRIRSSPFSDRTLVVVFSDHLALRNEASALLASSDAPPHLTFFANFPDGRKGRNDNPGLHYDVGPTILELLGYELAGQMGFGASLLEGPGFLIRRFGEGGWQEKEDAVRGVAAALWDDEVSVRGKDLVFDLQDLRVTIGDRTFSLRSEGFSDIPASTVFLFDGETLRLEALHAFPFDRGMDFTTLSRLLLGNPDALAFALSECVNLSVFGHFGEAHPVDYCFFLGKPGAEAFFWAPTRGDFVISAGEIQSLQEADVLPRVVKQREGLLREMARPRAYGGLAPPVYVAHAGGGIDGRSYTNSLEALEGSYELGHRFFEIDVSWTRDGQLAAIHDWEESLRESFEDPPLGRVPSLAEFKRLRPKGGLTQVTFYEALEWAGAKGDAYIVSDVKADNVAALAKVLRERADLKEHLIPQVYDYEEYAAAAAMGYEHVILTLYRMRSSLRELVDFAAAKRPFAITMHWSLAQDGYANFLKPWQVFVYAHTVNEPELFEELKPLGVGGIYTDVLAPGRPAVNTE